VCPYFKSLQGKVSHLLYQALHCPYYAKSKSAGKQKGIDADADANTDLDPDADGILIQILIWMLCQSSRIV